MDAHLDIPARFSKISQTAIIRTTNERTGRIGAETKRGISYINRSFAPRRIDRVGSWRSTVSAELEDAALDTALTDKAQVRRDWALHRAITVDSVAAGFKADGLKTLTQMCAERRQWLRLGRRG